MSAPEAIVERWIARTVECYPHETRSFLLGEQEPFRNPVGQTLRENLATLVREVLGSMDREPVDCALDALIRLRAVQDLSSADAVRFVFGLRGAIREFSGEVSELVQNRIDELALMAFDRYLTCREKVLELRDRELRFRAQCAVR